jgi:uroporphyrinogen-III decarboxylase
MIARERILTALDRRPPDRLAMWETTIWPETLQRWHAEGLPAEADLNEHFGLDPLACVNDLFDPSFGLPEQPREKTEGYRIYVDRYGKTVKEWLAGSNPPSILEPAIRSPNDWERVKPALTPTDTKFNNPVAEAQYQAARSAGHFTAITPAEPMWFVIYLTMGYEHGLRALARAPDLVADMVATYTDYLLAMLDLTHARGYRFDALWFWSDLCYRGGLLFSPQMARRLVLPHWQRLGQYARAHGMHFMFHCDGNVAQLIPLLLEAGVDAIHPLEARAGNDVRDYKRQFGDRLCLIGNIDADIVATNDRVQIEREVAAKVPVAAAGGGYIYNIDHSVPPTVSLDSYRYLLDCVRRYGAHAAG